MSAITPPATWSVGSIEIIPLPDGSMQLPVALFPGAGVEPALAEALQRDAGLVPDTTVPAVVHAFALRLPDGKVALMDAGMGGGRGPTLGQATTSGLAAAGIAHDDVSLILLTHLHGDHAGGLLDAAGHSAFPRAEIRVAEEELAFWTDASRTAKLPDFMGPTIGLISKVVGAVKGQLSPFAPGRDLLPGVSAVPLPGHTPGHTGYRIADGGESLFVWGDIIHVAPFQFARPDWSLNFDVDLETAAATRKKVFAELAASGEVFTGMHLPGPTRARLEKAGEGYRFIAT